MTKLAPVSVAGQGSRGQYEPETEESTSTLDGFLDIAKRLKLHAFYMHGSDNANFVFGVECVNPSGKHLLVSYDNKDVVARELVPHEVKDAFDIQSDVPVSVPPSSEIEEPDDYVTELKNIIHDDTNPLSHRSVAAMKVALVEPDFVRSWTLEQLADRASDTETSKNLIYLADELRFPREEDRNKLWQCLMGHAIFLRSKNDPSLNNALGTAIRRIASVIPESKADCLVDFLSNDSGIDTRLIALQSVCIIFSTAPYSGDDLIVLKDRINELRKKLVDRDMLFLGQAAAIASAAITASICVSFSSINDILDDLNSVQPWFRDVVKQALLDLANNWKISAGRAAQQLNDKLANFGQQGTPR
jgi:hypothetical protein